jgi:hypothetical protein
MLGFSATTVIGPITVGYNLELHVLNYKLVILIRGPVIYVIWVKSHLQSGK